MYSNPAFRLNPVLKACQTFRGGPSVQILGSFMHIVEKCLECPGTRGLAQLAQGLSFNLANALTGDGERPANLLQRPLRAVLHTKAHPDDLLFPRTESSQHTRGP